MGKKLIFSLFFILLMFAAFATAATITTQYFANASTFFCDGNWLQSSANVTDGNYNTYARFNGITTASCWFNYTHAPGDMSIIWNVRGVGDAAAGINVTPPAGCFGQNPYKFRVDSTSKAINANAVFWYCYNGTAWQNISASGAGNANNMLVYEQSLFVTRDNETRCPAKPNTPIFAADSFDYFLPVDSCHWSPTPTRNIYPTAGQLCFDATTDAQNFQFYPIGQGNFYSNSVWTQTYTFTLSNTSFFETALSFQKLEGGPRPIFSLSLFYDSDGKAQYYEDINGSQYLNSLCSGCWNPGTANTLKVSIYGHDAVGFNQFNSTSNAFQAIKPNTYSVQFNGGVTYFNLPILQTSTDGADIPYLADFNVYGGSMCLDDYLIYSGLIPNAQVQPNLTGIPYLQVGERCQDNWECFTSFCNYLSQCAKKSFGAGCNSSIECVSGKCAGNKCTKASLWQNIDATKQEATPKDTNSDNMISLVICLVLALAVTAGMAYMGGGIYSLLGGGVMFFIGLVFFTMVGWLSPFILVVAIIALVLIFAFIILIKSGG